MLSWLPWIISGGTVTWIALLIFAPRVLDILSPILKGMAEAFVELWKRLWNGAMDVLDSFNTILFVLLMCALSVWYFTPEPKIIYKDKAKVSTKYNKAPVEKEKPAFSLDGWEWFHR